ncbi:MAG: HAMP domain-containing protein [Deltaproteobacteria bacterium]|nr:HAMP domain-containing protein [Deltaproteobacteria bacterium]
MMLGVRGKLFLASLAAIAFSVVVADLYLARTLDRELTESVRDDLTIRAELIAGEARAEGRALRPDPAWDGWADERGRTSRARVTVIAADGTVVGDSEVPPVDLPRLENHAHRPEIARARADGRGWATRYSTTVGHRMMYVAIAVAAADTGAGGTIRLAVPLTTVDDAVNRLHWLLAFASLLALGAAVAFSAVAASWAARGVRRVTATARKMAGGDLAARTHAGGRDEADELGRVIDGLAEGLSRSMAELRDERDLLQGVLQGMREGVLLLDRDARIVLVNPALRESLLLDADVVGKLLLEGIRHAGLRDLIDAARKSGEPASGEIESAGLKPRRLLVHVSTLPTDSGGLLAVFVDVTDLRRLETIRRDFVANVSHELRTPVAAVRSAGETLRGALERDPAAAARFVEIIERNAERLQRLIEDLLDLSRIESQTYRPDLVSLDLGTVARHVLGLFRERAEARNLALALDLPADLPHVRADRRALEQVLTNLVDNAVKYCPPATSVTVRAALDGDKVRIDVADTGSGIEARHLARLFERFYRVDAGRSRELGGTGLGLSIVKHLVEAMGGSVSVESAPGRGTTFRCVLPRG